MAGVQVASVAMGVTAVGLAATEGGRAFPVPFAAPTVLLAVGWKAATPPASGHYWHCSRTDARRAAREAPYADHEPWIPRTHDDLSAHDAELFATAVRRGGFTGRLGPLSRAVSWP
ncbi:hypothetical protein ACFWA9_25210 [Kitasatospora sp. NPDC059973]|uniref:hypothetical protein n=1 Tax=Kitasatospora sp. NPDC059973 TaxID=3347020 RepID=UPI0036C5BF18